MTNTVTMTEMVKRTFYEMMKDVATSIPGHVLAYDPVTQMAQVQIGIVRRDVKGVSFTPPPLVNVPVFFGGGSDFTIEYQIDPGAEGLIVFSQRCVDGWMATGGVAQNPVVRFHDLSDAFFFPGVRSQPNVVSDFTNNGIRMRNKDGTQHIWLKNDSTLAMANGNGSITMAADGTVNINGAVITPAGKIIAAEADISGSLVAGGDEVINHVHDKGTYKDAENRPLLSGNSGQL